MENEIERENETYNLLVQGSRAMNSLAPRRKPEPRPRVSLFSKAFVWVSAKDTDIKKTFERLRAEGVIK